VPLTGAYFGFPMDFPLKIVIMRKHKAKKRARKDKNMKFNIVNKTSIFFSSVFSFRIRGYEL
jgi:hypothetical protein